MRRQTAMSTRTAETAGSKPRERPATKTSRLSPRPASRVDGEARNTLAAPLWAEAADGSPAQRARGERQAAAAAAAADDPQTRRDLNSGQPNCSVSRPRPDFVEEMMSRRFLRMEVASSLFILALVISLAACHQKVETPSAKVFATPDEAGEALLAAAKSGSQDDILAIFGPDSKDLLSSGDAVQDKNTVQAFIAAYTVMHRWRNMKDGSESLFIGSDNFPMAIPLKKNGSGQWYFDTAAGKDEMLNRRIGRDELAV